jgi:hypothetical protein
MGSFFGLTSSGYRALPEQVAQVVFEEEVDDEVEEGDEVLAEEVLADGEPAAIVSPLRERLLGALLRLRQVFCHCTFSQ